MQAFTAATPIFAFVVGGMTLYSVTSKGVYDQERGEWMEFVEERTRRLIDEGHWDKVVIKEYQEMNKEQKKEIQPDLLTDFSSSIEKVLHTYPTKG